jgi:hypothetical protein
MAGKFLRRAAIVDLVKSEHRTNAQRKRAGLTQHPIQETVCGCPDPDCGGWHSIRTERTILTANEADQALQNSKKRARAANKVKRKRNIR